MKQTANYQLNQWEKMDRIQMEDFNADNAKIDQVLDSLSTTVAGCGNCVVVHGSYVGTGTYQSDNPCTLTFDGKPLMVVICADDDFFNRVIMMRGTGYYFTDSNYVNSKGRVTWNENSVSWYCNNGGPNYQMNTINTTYCYIALLAAD